MYYFRLKNQILSACFSITIMILTSCTYETIPIPNECPDLPIIVIEEKTDTECASATGSIVLSVSGGEEPYNFTLQNTASNTSGTFGSLSAGTYVIEVADAKGCTSEVSVDILNSDGLNITVSTQDSGCGSTEGEINIVAEGGVEPYSFVLNGQEAVENSNFTGLAPGEYSIFVSDAVGCEITNEVVIQSDVVFAQVKTIITTNCAVSNCHDGSISPDLRSDQTIQSRAGRIQSRTGARTMPPGGRSISDSQIQQIACWVEDGANL